VEADGSGASAWRDVRIERLPPALQKPVRTLRGLAGLDELIRRPPWAPPDVAALRRDLALYRDGSGDAVDAVGIQQQLAAEVFYQGYPTEARRLLPRQGAGNPAHARVLLRQFKAMLNGAGGGRSDVPPPGLLPFVPEFRDEGWGAPPASDTAGPSPLELARQSQNLRQREKIERGLDSAEKTARHGTIEARARLSSRAEPALQQQEQDSEADETYTKQVERNLGRFLTPRERVLTAQVRREGYTTTQAVDVIRNWERIRAELIRERKGKS
jgi:hypothetical protein